MSKRRSGYWIGRDSKHGKKCTEQTYVLKLLPLICLQNEEKKLMDQKKYDFQWKCKIWEEKKKDLHLENKIYNPKCRVICSVFEESKMLRSDGKEEKLWGRNEQYSKIIALKLQNQFSLLLGRESGPVGKSPQLVCFI